MHSNTFVAIGASALLSLLLLGSAQAQTATMADNLVIEEPWAPATSDTATDGYAYFTMRNTGERLVRLIEVRAKVADIVTLGETTFESDGDVHHSAVFSVEIPPHSSVFLSPGGNLVLLGDLTAPLIEGTTFELRLTFYDGSQAKINVPVVAAIAPGPKAPHAPGTGQ